MKEPLANGAGASSCRSKKRVLYQRPVVPAVAVARGVEKSGDINNMYIII